MITRYGFNGQDHLYLVAFLPGMADRERLPPAVVNELGWPPDGTTLHRVFGDVDVKASRASVVAVSLGHRGSSDP
jgi:hypothetical protein